MFDKTDFFELNQDINNEIVYRFGYVLSYGDTYI